MRDVTCAPGTRLGPYEIRSARDLPGLGEVYDARDLDQRRDVAVRILRTDFGANPERLRRFEQDTRAAAALIHPNILTVHNIGTDAEAAYDFCLWSLVLSEDHDPRPRPKTPHTINLLANIQRLTSGRARVVHVHGGVGHISSVIQTAGQR